MGLDAEKSISTKSLVSKRTIPEISIVKRVLWLLNTLYNQILAILTVLLVWVFFERNPDRSSLRFWHLLLSTVAYVPLMAAAIIIFSEDNLISLYIRRTRRYWIHGILLLISCTAVTVGISLETNSKAKSGRTHFQSTHAILGLVSWMLVLVSVVMGLIAGNTQIFSSIIRPVIAKFVHNFLGIAGFVIGVGSLYTKLDYIQRSTSDNVFIASKWALWYITIWSLLAALKSLWGQLRTIFS